MRGSASALLRRKGQTQFSRWEITVGDHPNCCDKEDTRDSVN